MSSSILAVMCLIGTWQYAGFRYEDRDYPLPNPNLILQFTFNSDGTDLLRYFRTNETGTCERLATYSVKDGVLYQVITWVNPNNNFECAKDSDMQLGRESETKFQCADDNLGFLLDLNGKEFVYKLQRVTL